MTDTVNKALQRLKNDRTRARVVSQARKVQDKVSIDDVGFRQMTKGTAKDEIHLDRSYYPKEVLTDSERKRLQRAFEKKPNVTYRTQGKQDLLEGKPRKTTVSSKAGAGMQMLKAQMRRFGAKQWWQSKTH
jgi:hypothetical protein